MAALLEPPPSCFRNAAAAADSSGTWAGLMPLILLSAGAGRSMRDAKWDTPAAARASTYDGGSCSAASHRRKLEGSSPTSASAARLRCSATLPALGAPAPPPAPLLASGSAPLANASSKLSLRGKPARRFLPSRSSLSGGTSSWPKPAASACHSTSVNSSLRTRGGEPRATCCSSDSSCCRCK